MVQAFVNDVLCDMLNQLLFFYLNDILILSEAEEEYKQHVHLVLRYLLEQPLCQNQEK